MRNVICVNELNEVMNCKVSATENIVPGVAGTMFVGSDRYAIVVTEVVSPKHIKIAHLMNAHENLLTKNENGLEILPMDEDGMNVDAIGTRHAVFAVVAGNVLQSDDALGDLLVQIALFLFCQRYQRTIAEQVVLQVLHVSHAAQYGEHTLWRAGIAEGP